MKTRLLIAVAAVACCLLLLGAGALLSACGSDLSPGTTSTTDAPGTTAEASSTTTPPVTLSSWDRELADNAKTTNGLGVHLSEQGVEQDDPRVAMIFGLQARTQALSCRKAITDGDAAFVQQAMPELVSTVNRGRAVADGEVAELLADAYAIIETLGDPAADPQRSAALLDEFIATLAPLKDQASQMVATTGTT